MRFTSVAILASSLLATVGFTSAFPLEVKLLERRACNVTSCSVALASGLAVCAGAVGNSVIKKAVDPFSTAGCVAAALNAGVNFPKECDGCIPALQAKAKQLGIKACSAAKAGGACLINGGTAVANAGSSVIQACKGAFCKLTGQNPSPIVLPLNSGDIPLQQRPVTAPPKTKPIKKPTLPPPPKAVTKPVKPVAKPVKPLVPVAKPKPVVPVKPASLKGKPIVKSKPAVPVKPASLKGKPITPAKVKPVVPVKPAALKAPKVKSKLTRDVEEQ